MSAAKHDSDNETGGLLNRWIYLLNCPCCYCCCCAPSLILSPACLRIRVHVRVCVCLRVHMQSLLALGSASAFGHIFVNLSVNVKIKVLVLVLRCTALHRIVFTHMCVLDPRCVVRVWMCCAYVCTDDVIRTCIVICMLRISLLS